MRRALLAATVAACVLGCSIDVNGRARFDGGRRRDASARDGGVRDARARDTGDREDASPLLDAGPPDAGPPDTGTPDAGLYDVIDRECESGELFGTMVAADDPAAYGGRVVVVPGGTPDWVPSGLDLPPSRVELPMGLRGGDYDVWVRLFTLDGAHDAFYAGFVPADLRRFFHRRWGAWEWVRGNDDMPRALFFPREPAGPHRLVLGPGESETRCDRVIVTNDPAFAPPP